MNVQFLAGVTCLYIHTNYMCHNCSASTSNVILEELVSAIFYAL